MVEDGVIVEGKIKIKICQSIIGTMYNHIQKNSRSKESGGILIGKENKSDNNIVIKYITTSMKKDVRKNNKYIRKDKGHLDFFKNIYEKNENTVRYIGEWHTHFEPIPKFSGIDYRNWEKISRKSKSCNEFYHIIAGYEGFRIWSINSVDFLERLLGTFLWNEVYKDDEIQVV